MEKSRFIAAALQMCAGADRAANLATCEKLAAEASARGASLLVIPECFAVLGRREKDKLAVAEAIDPDNPGPILAALVGMAKNHGLWVVAGGMPETLPKEAPAAGTKAYNTCLVISPAGAVAAQYRKLHLFDVDIPGGAVLRESDSTAAGADAVVCETPLARLGLSICYDLRFPELYRELVVRRGAHVVVVPAAFTAHTGAAHWHVLLRSRAIENQCYVIAAAQWGVHNERRASYGHSMIIDPWGDIVAERPEGDGLAIAEIDLEVLNRVRRQMPCLDGHVLLR